MRLRRASRGEHPAWMLVGCLLALGGGAAHGAVYYVNANADAGTADGASWDTAFPDLQDALAAAVVVEGEGEGEDEGEGNEIWVAAGTYYPAAAAGARDATFTLPDGVAVYGGFAGTEASVGERPATGSRTKLSGDLARDDTAGGDNTDENCYHVVTRTGAGAAAELDGFTIRGGNATGVGIANAGAGGVHVLSGTLTMRDCRIVDNFGTAGGGLSVRKRTGRPAAVATVSGCYIGSNTADNGGGVQVVGSELDLTASFIVDNQAGWGGGILAGGSADAIITNCLIARNAAVGDEFRGGGLNVDGDGTEVELLNCTVVDNTATLPGAGAVVYDGAALDAVNGIFWGNAPGQFYVADDSTLGVAYSVVAEGEDWGDTNTGDDPSFRLNTEPYPYQPSWDSSAIAAAGNDAPATDILGDARGQNGGPDIGAYEFGNDRDGGGLPDWYEDDNGFEAGNPADDTEDADSDGLNNREEFARNTDPRDDTDPPADYYVAADGDDDGDGSAGNPWRSIGHAMRAAPEATATFSVTLHVSDGTYEEAVSFRPYFRLVGESQDGTVIRYFDAADDVHSVIEAAEGCEIQDCTIGVPGAPTDDVFLIRIVDESVYLHDMTVDGNNEIQTLGIQITGPDSSDSVIRDCVITGLQFGLNATDSAPLVAGNTFEDIRQDAVTVSPPAGKDDTVETPRMGDATDEDTGWNMFENVSGLLVNNTSGASTQAEANDWGTYDYEDLEDAMQGEVDFLPALKNGILSASIVCQVADLSSAGMVRGALVSLTPSSYSPATTDNMGACVFPMIWDGSYTLTVAATGYDTASASAIVSGPSVVPVTIRLNPVGGEAPQEGDPGSSDEGEGELPDPGDGEAPPSGDGEVSEEGDGGVPGDGEPAVEGAAEEGAAEEGEGEAEKKKPFLSCGVGPDATPGYGDGLVIAAVLGLLGLGVGRRRSVPRGTSGGVWS